MKWTCQINKWRLLLVDTADEAKNSNDLTQNGLARVNKSQKAVTELVSDIGNFALGRSR